MDYHSGKRKISNLSENTLLFTHKKWIVVLLVQSAIMIRKGDEITTLNIKVKHFRKKGGAHLVIMILQVCYSTGYEKFLSSYLNLCNADIRHIFDLLKNNNGELHLINDVGKVEQRYRIIYDFNRQVGEIMALIENILWSEEDFTELRESIQDQYPNPKKLFT